MCDVEGTSPSATAGIGLAPGGWPAVTRGMELSGEISRARAARRSEEHTSELQSLMRISYAVFCLKKKNTKYTPPLPTNNTYNTHHQPTTLTYHTNYTTYQRN